MTTSVSIINSGPDRIKVLVMSKGKSDIPGIADPVSIQQTHQVPPQGVSPSPIYVYDDQYLIVQEAR